MKAKNLFHLLFIKYISEKSTKPDKGKKKITIKSDLTSFIFNIFTCVNS